ncbi:MAG TPA: hypothetical protein VFZ01_14630 [Geminicoccaceae bacterium]
MDLAVGGLLVGVPLLYLTVQIGALIRWDGLSNTLAKVSAGVALGWLILFVVQVSGDPTSHNLWPFEVLMLSLGGLAWLGLVGFGRWISSRAER